jgi:hypothetical protein
MNKKSSTYRGEAQTFFLGRECLFCGEPIADQERSTKKHCTPWYDEYGIRHDCKRKRHQVRHAEHDNVLYNYTAKQREFLRQIERLVAIHGDDVTTEMLTAFGISLSEAMKITITPEKAEAVFLDYKIMSTPNSNKHKISKNGQ